MDRTAEVSKLEESVRAIRGSVKTRTVTSPALNEGFHR